VKRLLPLPCEERQDVEHRVETHVEPRRVRPPTSADCDSRIPGEGERSAPRGARGADRREQDQRWARMFDTTISRRRRAALRARGRLKIDARCEGIVAGR